MSEYILFFNHLFGMISIIIRMNITNADKKIPYNNVGSYMYQTRVW